MKFNAFLSPAYTRIRAQEMHMQARLFRIFAALAFFVCFVCMCMFFPLHTAHAADFDELDKPPEGAHKGQMLLGGFFSIGVPYGNSIDAENNFVKGSTYTFSGSGTTKLVEVSHLSFGMGLVFEYMPIDYVGIKSRLKRTAIVQRSNFGPDYENWRGYLYQDISLSVGPSFHTTSRKMWDFTLTPVIGYAFARYEAAPVAGQILSSDISGKRKKSMNGFTYGAELNCTLYFSGGLFISVGADWTRNMIDFGGPMDIKKNGATYFNGKSSGVIDSLGCIISAGYAFFN